jgi:hypothetical protein
VANATLRPLYPWERDPVPIVQEAGWSPRPVWTDAENFVPTGIRSPNRPNRSESLYRLRYPDPQHIAIFSRKITTLFETALTISSIIVSTEIVTPYAI